LGCGDFTVFDFFVGRRLSFALFLVFDNSALTFVATFAVSTLYRDAACARFEVFSSDCLGS
jgi:hypothetical protein